MEESDHQLGYKMALATKRSGYFFLALGMFSYFSFLLKMVGGMGCTEVWWLAMFP